MALHESKRRPRRDDHEMAIFSAIAGDGEREQPDPLKRRFGRDVVDRLWHKARNAQVPAAVKTSFQPLMERATRCFIEARGRLNGKP